MMATTTASVVPFGSALNIGFWLMTLVALSGLSWNETYRANPFISVDVVRNRELIMTAIAVSLRTFAHDGIRFIVVLYLATVFGLTPRTIGFFLLFYALPLFFGVAFGGFLADRWPSRIVGAIGLLFFTVGMFWPSLVDPNSGSLWLAPGLIVAAISAGVSLTPFTKTAVTSLGRDQVGFAAGLYNTLRFAGIATSTPLLGLLLARGFAQHGGLETVSEPYQLGFQLLALVTLVGSGVALLIPDDRKKTVVAR
jgi:predicted MFS family arabinose efflux permease